MTDVYSDTEYSVTMPAVLAEHRDFVIGKMPLRYGTRELNSMMEGIMMELDEAIKHCLEVAEKNEMSAITYKNCKEIKINMYEKLTAEKAENDCRECAADHRQLAEWLQELRAYRKFRICGNCRHYVYGTTHFGECHVTSDVEPCVVGIDQTACDTFFDYKDFRNGVEKPQT